MSDEQHILSDAIHEGMRKIANSITPVDAVAGSDATGNSVSSLSEAVIGLTAALCKIADEINTHALETRVAGEVCAAAASQTINASAQTIQKERDWAMAKIAKLQMELDGLKLDAAKEASK
jgi:hypothetical protein